MTAEKDKLYSLPFDQIGDFEFDAAVADVFPDMINRSVPGYASILAMIGEIAASYVMPNTRVYDLGCSLGACSLAIQSRIPNNCRIFAVDNAPAMLDRFRENLTRIKTGCEIDLVNSDIVDVNVDDASMVILNFTLQFVPLADRDRILARIALGTLPNGILVLSEKIRLESDDENAALIELHHAYKRANGYSELEIAQKRTAIENRLIPETLATHIDRLQQAGYRKVLTWFQCFNFVSILAIR